jgi:small nuclear ribonucleoprotein (snRNP)-like protein
LKKEITISNVATPITNYTYEERLNNRKRLINILKPKYLNIVFDDLEEMMQYKEGSTQYVSETLKRGDNIRLYQ